MTDRTWTIRVRPEVSQKDWLNFVLIVQTPERPNWPTSTYWLGWHRPERRLGKTRDFYRLQRLFPEVIPGLIQQLEVESPVRTDVSRPEAGAGAQEVMP